MSKLCIDCKFYDAIPGDRDGVFSRCTHPESSCKSRVNGRVIHPSCSMERLVTGMCGPNAKNFEPAPEPEPKQTFVKTIVTWFSSKLPGRGE